MIQVIERFHKIIEYVAREPEKARTMTELAGVLEVSAPACANIVKTMVHLGYLEKAATGRGYVLGGTPYFLTRKGPYKKYLSDIARPIMERLAQDINELIVLVTESGGRRVELLKFESDSLIQVKPRNAESIISLFRCATGVLILAHKPEDEFRTLWNTRKDEIDDYFHATDYDESRKRCAEIVAKGYYLSEPHESANISLADSSATMGFPVFEDGRVVASVGCRVPIFRFTAERREHILAACAQAARQISQAIASRQNHV